MEINCDFYFSMLMKYFADDIWHLTTLQYMGDLTKYVMLKSLCFYNSKEKVLMLINIMISKIFLTFTRNVSENKAFFDVSNPFIYKIEGLFYEQILMQKSCYYAENSCHEQKVLAILLY